MNISEITEISGLTAEEFRIYGFGYLALCLEAGPRRIWKIIKIQKTELGQVFEAESIADDMSIKGFISNVLGEGAICMEIN